MGVSGRALGSVRESVCNTQWCAILSMHRYCTAVTARSGDGDGRYVSYVTAISGDGDVDFHIGTRADVNDELWINDGSGGFTSTPGSLNELINELIVN